MAFILNSPWLSRFLPAIRAGLLVVIALIGPFGGTQPSCSQTTIDPQANQPAEAAKAADAAKVVDAANVTEGNDPAISSGNGSAIEQADAIQFDPKQTEPLLAITRQQLVNRRLAYRPVFELFADGKLTNRRGSATEKTIQLTPEEAQSILQQAINEAKFFSLDATKFQKQFTKAAVGNKSFRVKDQVITKFEVKVKQGQKTLAIRGYSLARLKLTELVEFQKLATVESICEYLLAKNIVGNRSDVVLAAINAEIKKRKLSMPEIKAKDLRAAYEREGGRFQARYFALTKPKPDAVANREAAGKKFEPQPIRITYFVKSQGAEPTIRFFGNTGE